MSATDKEIAYRASKIAEQRGISLDEAMPIATQEVQGREAALKAARRQVFAEKTRRIQKLGKKGKRKGPIYTVDGSVVDSIVSGGAPGLGKKS